jgi:imidazolonepropionase-like amidohydrolase
MNLRSAIAGLLLALPALAADADSFLLRGATVHTMAGAQIENGSVLVRNGRIIGVGKDIAAPKDVPVIDGKGLHVYPGLIDAATEIGLVEVNSVRETQDTTELGRFNPQLVALTAVNPASEHIPVTRANGITTVATMPQGPLVSGQVSLIHLDGWTTEEMGVSRTAGLHLRIPFIQVAAGGRGGAQADDETPGGRGGATGPATTYTTAKQNYDRQMAELNDYFESARRYKQAKDAKAPELRTDLKFEAMIPILEGKEPVLVNAVREREIRDAIAFADKQKIRIILCDAPEAYKVTKEIKEHNIPVILGPTLELPLNEDDPYDRRYTTPADLQKAGIRFAIGTFSGTANLSSRNLPYQAAQAVAFGLPHEDALRAITKNAAEIWGIADRVGTIEEGKWADLLVTDGDPLEAKTQVRRLFIKGKPVDLDNKQHQLYEKYLNRP